MGPIKLVSFVDRHNSVIRRIQITLKGCSRMPLTAAASRRNPSRKQVIEFGHRLFVYFSSEFHLKDVMGSPH